MSVVTGNKISTKKTEVEIKLYHKKCKWPYTVL